MEFVPGGNDDVELYLMEMINQDIYRYFTKLFSIMGGPDGI
jgi:hypothetical protein